MIDLFVLAARPRSGTHMLRTALCQHPTVYCHTEIFNPAFHIPFKHTHNNSPSVRKAIYCADRYIDGVSCKGFILHDQNMVWFPSTDWQNFPAQLPAIKLRRRDKFVQMISYCRAEYCTGRWQWYEAGCGRTEELDEAHKQPSQEPFVLKREHIKKYMAERQQADLLYLPLEQSFGEIHEVWYEDLVDHWEASLCYIFEFLGVEYHDVKPGTVKMNPNPKKIISNWDEARAWCQNDPAWKHLL